MRILLQLIFTYVFNFDNEIILLKLCEGRLQETLSNSETETRLSPLHRGADKSLARPRRKQVTATEEFDFHVSYL